MIGSDAFSFVNVLDKAADASWKRNEVIANNIANVDTPDFKRSDVTFETYLAKELTGRDALSKKVKNMDLSKLGSTTYLDHATLDYRKDGIPGGQPAEVLCTSGFHDTRVFQNPFRVTAVTAFRRIKI